LLIQSLPASSFSSIYLNKWLL